MKVYQVRETGGEWEDYYDISHETYFTREMAEARKHQLELNMCEEMDCGKLCFDCSWEVEDMKNYLCFNPDNYGRCKNATILSYDDNVEFKIEEIDVLEEKSQYEQEKYMGFK